MRYLYIIGNGFDIHHGIPSKYSSFQEWLSHFDKDTLSKLEEIFDTCVLEWWYEFEKNLGNAYDVKPYVEGVTSDHRPDYGSDDYRDRDLYEAKNEIEWDFGGLLQSLRYDFQCWANSLHIESTNRAIDIIRRDSFFLTFNYTHTLEKLYGIPSSQILHIHGDISCKDSILVGHGRDYASIRADLDDLCEDPPDSLPVGQYYRWYGDAVSRTMDDFPTIMAKDTTASLMMSVQKNVATVISKNQSFFRSLKEVEKIYIYGFSFSDIDIPYIEEVMNNVQTEVVDVEISYYSPNDQARAKAVFEKIPKPNNISFVRLEEKMTMKQLELFQ